MLTGTADSGDATAPAAGRIVAQRRAEQPLTSEDSDSIAGDSDTATGRRHGQGPGRRADLLSLGSYLLGALFVVSPVLAHYGYRLAPRPGDRLQFEIVLGTAAQAVAHLDNPLHVAHVNAPFGVNGMANTTVLGLGI